MIFALLVGLPLLGGLVAAAGGRSRRPALVLAAALCALIAVVAAIRNVALDPTDPLLVYDATSRLFAGLVNLLFLGISAHVASRASSEPAFQSTADRFAVFGLFFLAAANATVLANDLLLGWCALELTTFAAAPLVADDRTPSKMRASWQYFLFSSVGLALVLAGLSCLHRAIGPDHMLTATSLPLMVTSLNGQWGRLGVALVIAGYGTKLGLFPMNNWLPTTYAAAPAPVTALLGAIQFNCALVGLLRILYAFHGSLPPLVTQELLWIGMLTMAVSTLGIITTRDYLRLLGYASINHAGVIAVGLSLGGTAAYGVLLYAVSNAFIKAILFLTAGRVYARFGTSLADDVRGLVKAMPFSGLSLMVGTFALLGLPPFGSFLGELMMLSALVESGRTALLFPFCASLVASFVATGRTLFPMIWGENQATPVFGDRLTDTIPKAVFLVALVALGLYIPAPINVLLRDAATHLGAP